MPQININSDLLVAQPLPGNKVSWTLASRLGDMLDMAEKLFGGRDTSYTLLGTQFTSDGPRIWYRGKHRKHIIIQLSPWLLQTCRKRVMKWLRKQSIYSRRVLVGVPTILKKEFLATLLRTT